MNGEEMLQLFIFHPYCMELQGNTHWTDNYTSNKGSLPLAPPGLDFELPSLLCFKNLE